jgi:hypothetical protein
MPRADWACKAEERIVGVNLILETLTGERHPDWDPFINGGHKQFAREVLHTLPLVTDRKGENPWVEDIVDRHRPADFAAWRAAVADLPNPELFAKMIDIMQRDEKYWLYVSQ